MSVDISHVREDEIEYADLDARITRMMQVVKIIRGGEGCDNVDPEVVLLPDPPAPSRVEIIDAPPVVSKAMVGYVTATVIALVFFIAGALIF